MTYLAATALINSVFSSALGLALLASKKDRKSVIAVNSFAAMCLAVAWWAAAYYFWQVAATSSSALSFIRLSEVGAIMIAVFFIHFVIYLRDKPSISTLYFLYASYLTAALLEIFTFSKFHITSLRPVWFFQYWPVPGPLYAVRLTFWMLLVIYGIILLLRLLGTQRGNQRKAVIMITTGTIIGFIGGSMNYLPWYGIDWLPWGNGFVVAYIGLIGYAIIKYRALNIKTTTIRLIAFLITVTVLIELLAARTLEDFIIRLALTVTILILSQITIAKAEQDARNKDQRYLELKKIHLANMEYISDIAHRLKTPLAIIEAQSAGSQITAPATTVGKSPRADSRQATLANINRVARTAATTMRNIVTVGKIDADLIKVDKKPADLARLLTLWKPDFTALLTDHRFKLTLSPLGQTDCLSNLDINLLREALLNLLDNARKYSPAGSRITLSLAKADKWLVLTVADQGTGITSREISHIFNRHWQSRRQEKTAGSAGLGLSLVKWIVEQHQGEITVTSRPAHGTTFTIKLPLATPALSRVSKIVTKI